MIVLYVCMCVNVCVCVRIGGGRGGEMRGGQCIGANWISIQCEENGRYKSAL